MNNIPLNELVDKAKNLIFLTDKDGNLLYANHSWYKAMDLNKNESKNIVFYDTLCSESRARIADAVKTVLEGGSVERLNLDFITKAGRKIYTEGNLTCYYANGRPLGVFGIFQDITSQKLADNELMERTLRFQAELQLANIIQTSLFPINLPQIQGAGVAATVISANEVGGDYCDLFITNQQRLGIAIGDVMGKGIPAALFMVLTYAFVRNYAFETEKPSELVNWVNRSLFPQLDFSQSLVTFFYGLYDPVTKELIYTNAGHNPPVVYRAAAGECELLKVRDYFIGGRYDAEYREGKTQLKPGDVVFFYTDGLKEGRNKSEEQFGIRRIKTLLKENHALDPASIQEIIHNEFLQFLEGKPPSDDVTIVVLKIH